MSVLEIKGKYPIQEWNIQSSRGENVQYTLSLWGDHRFSCTCPRFTFKEKFCKHIQSKRHEIENLYGNIHNYLEMLKERKKDVINT